MTLVHTSNNVELSSVVPLEAETGFAFAQSAEVGSPETVSVLADDPTLALSFTGLKTWYMTETAIATGATGQVWRGYIGKKTLSHTGGDIMFPTGRVWQVELHEINFLLSRVNFAPDHATANRPAETYNARMAWLLSVAPFAGVMIDHGLIQSSTLSMDASDYRNRTCDDVLKDLALATNFNYLLRFRAASNDIELICHEFNTSGLDTSTFRISNVAADVDSVTTWAPFFDTQLEIDPSRIADAVTVAYGNGGYKKVSNSATTTAFAPQHQMAPGGPFKSLATATVQANRLLAEMDEEEETVTVTVRLPAASLNNVLVGQLISAKFSHFPNWTTFRSCRVMRKEFGRPENRTQAFYDVRLKLVPVDTPCSGSTDLNLAATVTGLGEHALASAPTSWTPQMVSDLIPLDPENVNDGNASTNSDRIAHIEGGAAEDRLYRSSWISDLGSAQTVVSHLVKYPGSTQSLAEEIWYSTDGTTWTQEAGSFSYDSGQGGYVFTHAATEARYWALRRTHFVAAGVFADVGRILINTWAILGCS